MNSDKTPILDEIIFMLKVANELRTYGIFNSFMMKIKDRQDDFLALGYSMICSGIDPNAIEKILNNLINLECDPYLKQKKAIQAEGLLASHRGYPIAINALLMLSHLGLDAIQSFESYLKENDAEFYSASNTGLFIYGEFLNASLSSLIVD